MKAWIEAQGSLLLVRMLEKTPHKKMGGSGRGRIREFSYKSRLRLMRFMARIKMVGVRATFITLTFKGYPTNAEAKRCLHAFMQHIRRTYPKASAVWRMEYQKRGSIHFHLLCFSLDYWPQKALQETWQGITGETTSRVDIRLVRSRKGVMSYVSKYIAKSEKKSGKTSLVHVPYLHKGRKWRKGRFWGYHNKKALPLGEKVMGVLTDTKTIKRLAAAAWEIIGQETRYGSISFHLFHDNAEGLARRNIEAGGMFLDEFRWTVDVPEAEKFIYSPYTDRFSEAELENDYAKRPRFKSRASVASSSTLDLKSWVSRQSIFVRSGNSFA